MSCSEQHLAVAIEGTVLIYQLPEPILHSRWTIDNPILQIAINANGTRMALIDQQHTLSVIVLDPSSPSNPSSQNPFLIFQHQVCSTILKRNRSFSGRLGNDVE